MGRGQERIAQRRVIVERLTKRGMSTRAIATQLDVDQKTVVQDQWALVAQDRLPPDRTVRASNGTTRPVHQDPALRNLPQSPPE